MEPADARRAWIALEPYHLLVYFAPEPRDAYVAAGLESGRMGYFASRAAAMGAVSAGVVVATFYGFAPPLVAQSIPRAWQLARPADVVRARLAGIDAALQRALRETVDGEAVAHAAALARRAAEHAPIDGRPLAAAHLDLDWPDEPHLVLWHALTVLREHRGDGHVASLLTAGLDGAESLVLHAAVGALDGDVARKRRGWTDEEWAAAVTQLAERGLVDSDGHATPAGRAARQAVEDRTDALALDAWRALGDDAFEDLLHAAAPLVERVLDAGDVPFPNPMGLPRA